MNTVLEQARASGAPLQFKVLVSGMDGQVWGDFIVDRDSVRVTDWKLDAEYIGECVLDQVPSDFANAIGAECKSSVPEAT